MDSFWLSKTVSQAPLESRAQAAPFIQSFLSGDLATPEPNSDELDINAITAIPEAMLHTHVMDAHLSSEELETLEAIGTAEDVRQWKLQRLNLVYAAPSRPGKTPALGLLCWECIFEPGIGLMLDCLCNYTATVQWLSWNLAIPGRSRTVSFCVHLVKLVQTSA